MRRALAACAVSAAVVWPVAAPAADTIETVIDLVAQERYAEAREKLEPLLDRDPTGPRVRLMNGILRAREGRPRDAIAIFERLRDDHPSMFEPYNNLAVLYADQDRLDAARKALMAALERKPDAVVFANLGDVYTRLARRAYASAREMREGDAAATPAPGTASIPMPASKPAPEVAPDPVREEAPAPVREEAPAPSARGGSRSETAALLPAEPAPPPEPAAAPPPEPAAAAPPETGDAGEAGPVSTAALSGVCVSAGQFEDRAAATEAAEWIQAQGAELIGIDQRERQVASRHWVHLPAAPTRDAARKLVADLRAKGVRDIGIARKDGQPNVVSLGVYGSKSNMTRRVAQLEKLGYRVAVSTSHKLATSYVVRARAGAARASFDGPWKARFPRHAIGYVDCPAGS